MACPAPPLILDASILSCRKRNRQELLRIHQHPYIGIDAKPLKMESILPLRRVQQDHWTSTEFQRNRFLSIQTKYNSPTSLAAHGDSEMRNTKRIFKTPGTRSEESKRLYEDILIPSPASFGSQRFRALKHGFILPS